MWYEILSSGVIMVGILAVPGILRLPASYLVNGRKWQPRDETAHSLDYVSYLRDVRLTGSFYKPQGLETIPDLKE